MIMTLASTRNNDQTCARKLEIGILAFCRSDVESRFEDLSS